MPSLGEPKANQADLEDSGTQDGGGLFPDPLNVAFVRTVRPDKGFSPSLASPTVTPRVCEPSLLPRSLRTPGPSLVRPAGRPGWCAWLVCGRFGVQFREVRGHCLSLDSCLSTSRAFIIFFYFLLVSPRSLPRVAQRRRRLPQSCRFVRGGSSQKSSSLLVLPRRLPFLTRGSALRLSSTLLKEQIAETSIRLLRSNRVVQ